MFSSEPNMNSDRARASSVLPTPVGPRNMKTPIGRRGVLEAGAGATHGLGERLDRLVLADDAVVDGLFHVQEAL